MSANKLQINHLITIVLQNVREALSGLLPLNSSVSEEQNSFWMMENLSLWSPAENTDMATVATQLSTVVGPNDTVVIELLENSKEKLLNLMKRFSM